MLWSESMSDETETKSFSWSSWYKPIVWSIGGFTAILLAIGLLAGALKDTRNKVCSELGEESYWCIAIQKLIGKTPPSPSLVQPSVTQQEAPVVESPVLQNWLDKLPPRADRLYWDVGVVSCRVDQDYHDKVESFLKELGFTNLRAPVNEWNREDYFARNTTLFYYSEVTYPIVNALAELLISEFGIDIAVNRGAGLGVSPELRDQTTFLHLISSGCP